MRRRGYAFSQWVSNEAKELPPVARGVQNPNDRDAARMGQIEDQDVLEILDAPLAQVCEFDAARVEGGAYSRLGEQISEGLLGAGEEAIRGFDACSLCKRRSAR